MNIISIFDDHVRQQPDKAFLCAMGHIWSYAEVDDMAGRAAAFFQLQGVGKGDRVGFMCFNTPGFVFGILGAWRVGAVVVPINHKLQAPEVDYILAHAKVKLLILDGALQDVADRLTVDIAQFGTEAALSGRPSFDAFLQTLPMVPSDDLVDEGGIAEILYTSGTTGRPKGCLLSHENIYYAAIGAMQAVGITHDERMLIAMPLWHSSPLNNWFLGTLCAGGTVVLLREYHPKSLVEMIMAEKMTAFFGSPIAWLLPLQMGLEIERYDLRSLRACVYGGGPISAETARRLMEAYPNGQFYQVFGMTETGPTGTVLYPQEQITKAGSIGRTPVPGAKMRVVRDDGVEARPGDVGELWLQAPSLMQGYLDAPEATSSAIIDGWYHTGDLVRLDEDGYLFVVDRRKDMIITGGENVYSKEVEDALIAHPSISDAAVVGHPHPEWGETVVAYIVPTTGMTINETELQAFLATRLAKYKIPRRYHVREALPRTPTGKLSKTLLRKEEDTETN